LEKSFEPWATWGACDPELASDALAHLAAEHGHLFDDSIVADARCSRLSFYDEHLLLALDVRHAFGTDRIYVLHSADETLWLDGKSDPVHATNETESLALTDATVDDYVRFFLYFVRTADDESFTLIESQEEIALPAGDVSEELRQRLAAARRRVTPLTTPSLDGDGRWAMECSVAFGSALYAVQLAVAPDGIVEMTDDDPVEALDGLNVAECAPLRLFARGPDGSDRWHGPLPGSDSRGQAYPVGAIVDWEAELQADAPTAGGAASEGLVEQVLDDSAALPRDRDVTEAIVAVLLEDALREHDATLGTSNTLLRHFNSETGGDKQIERLTRLVSSSVPVIVIESDIPFVEDFVAGLIDGASRTGGGIVRADVVDGDELRCKVAFDNPAARLHLISFHAYRGLVDAERTAHELAIRDATVLVGCERLRDVPEALRRIADLVLTFPRIDRGRFARIFERVFRTKPPAGWQASGTDWTRYLVPADFHAPRRLNLAPDDATAFLRERVERRLRQVTPDTGLGLKELRGMGEALQVCDDLLADIRAAQAGRIPWSAVDRGMLLVGAPGTGKTSLARALAKECGIKFVVASASSWQSAGYLDSHIRAMRADFTEARRYAPSILFIDELDSIGSREHVSGHNAQYHTEVINSLLEQIQGIDTADSVIVIGATNYLEKIDPALRRAGRLDQVVRIPLPNVEALAEIFTGYLEPYRKRKEVARGIGPRELGELSFGLTGADVELFVRGAARRARRAGRKIKQEDLVAEITRRPRRPDSAPRLGPDEMRRVAVHEAGHTVARLTSSTRGEDLTFVTIVPRLDGSLGFVASAPDERNVATRRTMLEELETVLAGRAAEEVVYGADEIGAGAGGPSRTSDLAVATRMAELIVCRTGLGGNASLRWTEQPTATQEKHIDALLANAYTSIVARLLEERALLDRVAALLVEKQELSGAEVRKLVGPPLDDTTRLGQSSVTT
jgi:AAA+ superfamily predicted ATPase